MGHADHLARRIWIIGYARWTLSVSIRGLQMGYQIVYLLVNRGKPTLSRYPNTRCSGEVLDTSAWESGVVLAQNDHASLACNVTFHKSLLIVSISKGSA